MPKKKGIFESVLNKLDPKYLTIFVGLGFLVVGLGILYLMIQVGNRVENVKITESGETQISFDKKSKDEDGKSAKNNYLGKKEIEVSSESSKEGPGNNNDKKAEKTGEVEIMQNAKKKKKKIKKITWLELPFHLNQWKNLDSGCKTLKKTTVIPFLENFAVIRESENVANYTFSFDAKLNRDNAVCISFLNDLATLKKSDNFCIKNFEQEKNPHKSFYALRDSRMTSVPCGNLEEITSDSINLKLEKKGNAAKFFVGKKFMCEKTLENHRFVAVRIYDTSDDMESSRVCDFRVGNKN